MVGCLFSMHEALGSEVPAPTTPLQKRFVLDTFLFLGPLGCLGSAALGITDRQTLLQDDRHSQSALGLVPMFLRF